MRAGLVRRARRLGVDAESAQDLAQEVLYEAWRSRDRVYDPAGVEKWVGAIFGNVYLRWLRRHGRDRTREERALAARPDDGFDIEVELERRELAELLDRALALLPDQTRDVLVHRFVGELPVGEVAARLGLSEGAVQMRLQRGKLALRRTLVTEYGDDARAFGLIGENDVGWQQTRIWCPNCGNSKWLGRFTGPRRRLELRCTECAGWNYIDTETAHLGLTGFRSTMFRTAAGVNDFWRERVWNPAGDRHRITVRRQLNPHGAHYVEADCPHCAWQMSCSLDACALFTTEGLRFWRENPRIRRIAYDRIEADGVPAVYTAFESVTGGARFDAVLTQHEFRVVEVARS